MQPLQSVSVLRYLWSRLYFPVSAIIWSPCRGVPDSEESSISVSLFYGFLVVEISLLRTALWSAQNSSVTLMQITSLNRKNRSRAQSAVKLLLWSANFQSPSYISMLLNRKALVLCVSNHTGQHSRTGVTSELNTLATNKTVGVVPFCAVLRTITVKISFWNNHVVGLNF